MEGNECKSEMKKKAVWYMKLIKPIKRCSPLRTVGLPPRLGNREEPAEDLDGAAPAATTAAGLYKK